MIFHYPLSTQRKRNVALEVYQSIYFISDHIQLVKIEENAIVVHYEEVQVTEDVSLKDKLQAYIDDILQTRFSMSTLLDNRADVAPFQDKDAAPYLDVGGLKLNQPLVKLQFAFDQLFLQLARKHGATMRKYPSIISRQQMIHSGYLLHFPQHVYTLSQIPHQDQKLETYRNHIEQEQHTSHLYEHSNIYLQPCICFHVYEDYARNNDTIEDLELITASGNCYRHESHQLLSTSRLQEFYMREIVFLGKPKRVEEMRMKLIEETWQLFQELGMRGSLQAATDPFYFVDDSSVRFFQSSNALKYELKFSNDDQHHFSIASFNLCGHVLCEAFHIDHLAKDLHSGCVGFGIDRWMQAFLSVHGCDEKTWPDIIKHWM
ncbi:aminoacyl--tRNA ligase-related protein [Longirhabdus pacifica]|uniref:aminoacyl--tRNA ligase-related protein n=1 Tax=Longirhabdus pacifica TaxID=2305227 RepID=UPI0010092376|nr:aminoacyl--tRNA ligase-related protein [Longirhabdus pacifica]